MKCLGPGRCSCFRSIRSASFATVAVLAILFTPAPILGVEAESAPTAPRVATPALVVSHAHSTNTCTPVSGVHAVTEVPEAQGVPSSEGLCAYAVGIAVSLCGAAALTLIIPDPVPGADEILLSRACIQAIRQAKVACKKLN